MKLFIGIMIGWYCAKMDTKYGRKYGYKMGAWTRKHILRLDPLKDDTTPPNNAGETK
jgi:hypothetical protein